MSEPPGYPLLTFARVTLGELTIGVDTRFVVRALAHPERLTRLPRSHGAVDGVFSHGGQLVPVVDLRQWMEAAQAQDAPLPKVLVLGAHGRTVGLAIDAVHGLARVRQSQIRRIHHESDQDDFFHSVAEDNDAVLLSLLDPLRLMERVQAWSDTGTADDPGGTPAQEASRAATASYALVTLANETLAVPAALLAQVLTRPVVQPLFSGPGPVLGMFEWRGRHVPLLDSGLAFGVRVGVAPLAMVLAEDDSAVAVPIDAVVAVRTLPAGAIHAAADVGIKRALIEGVAMSDGVRVMLLDAAGLLAAHAAPGLSAARIVHLDGQAGRGGGKQAAGARAHVVFDTGRLWAIAMEALDEIMPLPAELMTDTDAHAHAGSGLTCIWRGRALPVLDLREPRSDAPDQTPQRLMVVRHAGRNIGIRVRDVVELLPALAGEMGRFKAPGGASVLMITTGQGSERTSYPVLDPHVLQFFTPG